MSFFENLGLGPSALKESEKVRTIEQSNSLIEDYLLEYKDLVDYRNHRKFNTPAGREHVYRFTVKLLSLDFLSKMGKDKRVKNVFFSPATPPPGGGMDGISMRYKIYVEYY